ncbi:NADP-dependent succinic semialdehyde dehydrogenase [Streptomyces sp. MH60]|uniref:NADP-dependent succinic semialdehyde dehydrogenase n=1 Tax=Streptomyces sp. MH60 TaxID=1940758 RepID=UPI000CEF12B1|nr:NADP-dependent succinic semialdehyde dehydrogenase [Streptomyces sp. MH60]PPS90805.1 Succinate-semialdehyde dehydrogenase [NADP(+)] 1 [Streptomyces sp. MH60]
MPIATVNPATGELVRSFPSMSPEEVEERLALSVEAAREMRRTTFAQRAAWMRTAADLVTDESRDTAGLLTEEMGKPITQARAEVLKSGRTMRYYADHAEEMLADQPLGDPAAVGASAAFTRYEPLGAVLAVMPWNFPMWQVIRFAAPALMAGNVGLLKHASNVPQTALYLDDLFARAGFPRGAFQALLIGSSEVERIVRDRRVAAVTLTGSEPAGRAVAAVAGSEVKKTVLELGGSDPFVVLPSADVQAAARTAVAARTVNNGQSCVAAKRFIVHTDVYDAFVQAFVEGTKALVVGAPMEEATDVGPLATETGRRELVELVEDAVSLGARLRCGGAATEGLGWFFEPAVLENVTPEMRLYREEAFGPVAVVLRVADVEEAVSVANDTAFGLSSSVWTTDPEEERLLVERLDAGAVFVNGMTVSHPELPFGGTKNSGIGRELATEGLREFCNLKTVWRG